MNAGLKVRNKRFFDTIVVENATVSSSSDDVVNLRHFENGDVGISLDETHDLDDVNRILKCFGVSSEVTSISTSSVESPERTSCSSVEFENITLSMYFNYFTLSCFNYVRRISFFSSLSRIPPLVILPLEYKIDYDANSNTNARTQTQVRQNS